MAVLEVKFFSNCIIVYFVYIIVYYCMYYCMYYCINDFALNRITILNKVVDKL